MLILAQDASRHGELSCEKYNIRRHWIWSWGDVRPFHVQCMPPSLSRNASQNQSIIGQMSYDTPMSGAGQQLASLPLKEQLRKGFKDMGIRSFSSAKNFGLVGAIFAGTECCIEGVSTNVLTGYLRLR